MTKLEFERKFWSQYIMSQRVKTGKTKRHASDLLKNKEKPDRIRIRSGRRINRGLTIINVSVTGA